MTSDPNPSTDGRPARFPLPPPRPARLAAVVLSAAALSLVSPPLNLHWLQWFVYVPMFLALDPLDMRSNIRLSWLYGIVGVGLLFRWIVDTIAIFSPIPIPLAAGILLLFAAVFGAQYIALWPAVHPLRRALGPWWVVVFPALEVAIEWVAMQLLLFPYQHGVTQYRNPYVWQLASVTGVWGVSYLVFLVNAALAEAVFRWREHAPFPRPLAAGVGGFVLLVVAGSTWRYGRLTDRLEDAPVLRVAQLQSDKGMEYRLSHGSREAWSEWLGQTRRIPAGAADLVVWPEGACPYDLNSVQDARDLLGAEARRGDWEMVVGAGTRVRTANAELGESRVSVFNSVYFFEKDGEVQGYYNKLVPLPFGEYVPLRGILPDEMIRDWADLLNIGDFQAGEEATVFTGEGARIATPICYEATLPRVCRSFQQPSLLVTVTNDAWFGDTANPHQHAMLAASRAMELGVPMVRSAYTGVSMIVEPTGDISFETEPFALVNRVATVRLASFPTFYAAWGDWFPTLSLLLALFGVARARRHAQPAGSADPPSTG
jgi:apolipoprotein N-acyltransferase